MNYGAGTQPVFIDEYDATTTPSTLLQTFALPIVASGAQQPFSLLPSPRGAAVPNGFLTLSADQRYVTLAGYAAPPGTPLSALQGPGVPRVIARMDWQGNIDTSTITVLGDSSATAFSILSACSYDGSGFVFTTDYVPNAANLNVGTPLLVNYQAFGTNVSSLAQVKTFSSPLALARSTSAAGAGFLGGAQPILGPADGWRQCQYVNNQLTISHTWGSVATSLPNALGDLSVAAVTGPITDANLDVDFSQRYTWSPNVKGAAGFAFFDNSQHLAVCDRGNSIAIFADGGSGTKCMGSATATTAAPNTNYVNPSLSSAASSAITSVVDISNNCHSVAASRDGLGVFFTTDSQAGYSRLFRIDGWVPGGGVAAPVTQWIPCNNWWYYTPGTTTINPDNNRCGAVNTYWFWFGAAAAPSLAGVAQTPQWTQGQACPAGYALASGGTACSICLANTYSASANAASCASCPVNSQTSLYGQTSCACKANFTSSGTSGASLVCTACPANAASAPGSSTCTCNNPWAVYQAGSNSCYLAPSATPTSTPTPSPTMTPSPSATATPTPSTTATESLTASASVTPTRSLTSTSSLSATPSTTATMTPSPTITPSPTVTPTASNTPTPSVTASPTSLPDSLLAFAFVIAPAAGAGVSLPASAIVAYPAIPSAIRASFASYLGLPLGSIGITNVSDAATGAQVSLVGLGLTGRRLPAAAAGSMGARVWISANLGKAPAQAALNTMVTSLQAAPPSLFAPIIAPVVNYVFNGNAAVGAKLGASVDTATISLANTNLVVLPAPNLAASSSSSSSGSSATTSVGVGLGVGLSALFLAIWSYRSWAKQVPTRH